MKVSHSISISAPLDSVFALYEDVSTWPSWDSETAAVHLPQGLQLGSSGWLKPRKGPKARIRVAEVTPGRSFTMEGRLPLCRMYFDHQLEPQDGGAKATHSVRFSGPLSFLFRRLIGKEINASLPTTLRGLKTAGESRGIAA